MSIKYRLDKLIKQYDLEDMKYPYGNALMCGVANCELYDKEYSSVLHYVNAKYNKDIDSEQELADVMQDFSTMQLDRIAKDLIKREGKNGR